MLAIREHLRQILRFSSDLALADHCERLQINLLTFSYMHGFSGPMVKNGDFGGKIGEEVWRSWPPTNSFLLLEFTPLCPIWWNSTKKCDHESEQTRTDTHRDRRTDRQTQNDFIICPMLYAIAMGQIITLNHATSDCFCNTIQYNTRFRPIERHGLQRRWRTGRDNSQKQKTDRLSFKSSFK